MCNKNFLNRQKQKTCEKCLFKLGQIIKIRPKTLSPGAASIPDLQNELPELKPYLNMFADDTKLIKNIKNIKDCK